MIQTIDYLSQWKNDYHFRLRIASNVNAWCSKYFLCELDAHTILKLIHPTILQLTSKEIAVLYKQQKDEVFDEHIMPVLLNELSQQNVITQFIIKNKKILQYCHPIFSKENNTYELENSWYDVRNVLEKIGKNKAKHNEILSIIKEFNRLKSLKIEDFFSPIQNIYTYYTRYKQFENMDTLKYVQDTFSYQEINLNDSIVDFSKKYLTPYTLINFNHLGSYPCSHLLHVIETYQKYPSSLWLLTSTTNKLDNNSFIGWLDVLIKQENIEALNKNINILKQIITDYGDMVDMHHRRVDKISVTNYIIGALTNTKSAVQYLATPNTQLEQLQLIKNIDIDSYLDTLIFLEPHLKNCFESGSYEHAKSWQGSLRNKIRIFEKIQPTLDTTVEEFDLLF